MATLTLPSNPHSQRLRAMPTDPKVAGLSPRFAQPSSPMKDLGFTTQLHHFPLEKHLQQWGKYSVESHVWFHVVFFRFCTPTKEGYYHNVPGSSGLGGISTSFFLQCHLLGCQDQI